MGKLRSTANGRRYADRKKSVANHDIRTEEFGYWHIVMVDIPAITLNHKYAFISDRDHMFSIPKKPTRYILLGLILFLASGFMNGFMGALGNDVYESLKAWVFSPKQQINFVSVIADALTIIGLVLLGYGLYLRLPDYNAKIVGKRTFRAGEIIRFKARFRGELHNGFFTCKVRAPEDTILSNTKRDHVWWPAYDTYENETGIGKINGKGVHKKEWPSDVIPADYPHGEYRAFIRLYEYSGKGQKMVIRQREQVFTIVGS